MGSYYSGQRLLTLCWVFSFWQREGNILFVSAKSPLEFYKVVHRLKKPTETSQAPTLLLKSISKALSYEGPSLRTA